jgi:hypothetical protein
LRISDFSLSDRNGSNSRRRCSNGHDGRDIVLVDVLGQWGLNDIVTAGWSRFFDRDGIWQ